MIKKILLILIAMVISQNTIYAKAVAPKQGTIRTFSSANKIYSIDMKIIGYPDSSPSECTFKENNKIVWEKELSSTPGFVDISDDGKFFVFANWGWYDEGGYKSLSFYSGAGNLLKTIEFGSGGNGMRWLEKTCISSNGNYYIAANGFKDDSQITLYHTPTQTAVWDKHIGLGEIDNILINKTGDFILISTFDFKKHNIHFSYLDRAGNILWEKETNGGHLWKNNYIWLDEDGLKFKVYDINKHKWSVFENHKNKIILKWKKS
jgi:hypothetical protein